MMLYDKDLAKIVDTSHTMEIENRQYLIKSNRSGSCDGCSFERQKSCPNRAVTVCTSNGGNILVEKEKPESK